MYCTSVDIYVCALVVFVCSVYSAMYTEVLFVCASFPFIFVLFFYFIENVTLIDWMVLLFSMIGMSTHSVWLYRVPVCLAGIFFPVCF